MKNWTTIALCLLCCMQAVAQTEVENLYTFDEKDEIVINEKFIDHHVKSNDQSVKPYELVGVTTFEVHSEKYELHVLNYKGWKDEAGDFRVIRLYHEGKQILEFADDGAWIGDPLFKEGKTWLCDSINSKGSPFSQIMDLIGEHAIYKGHCLVYPLANDVAALLLEGFTYGTGETLTTIVAIKDGKAKVVYNKCWYVTGIYANENKFELYLGDDHTTPQYEEVISTTSDGTMEYCVKPHEEGYFVYTKPEIMPVFYKGRMELSDYLRENIRYPDACRDAGIQGRVIVDFVVTKEGRVSDARVVKSAHKYLDKEALRVVNNMPYWRPGAYKGKRVNVQLTMPIIFRLQKDETVKVNTTTTGDIVVLVSEEPLKMTTYDSFDLEQDDIEHEKAINMLTSFYKEYVLRGSTKPFQLDATKYCTPRFLSKLGDDYEKQLREDYIVSQEELGLEWWSFYNFINGYQDGPNEIDEVMKVVPEHDNTYRIYFIECGYENHRLIDFVERNDSLFIDDVYRIKYELMDNSYKPVRY